jgi:hypothetical protein
MNQLIRCINCDAVFLKTPFDQWAEYEPCVSSSPESLRSIEKDDLQEFLKYHREHWLEELEVVEDSFVSEKPYFEPIKTSYFRATNGKEQFVIKKSREKIDEPLKYELIAGDYSLKLTGLEVQSKEIRNQLDWEFKGSPLSQNKIASFLRLYQHIAGSIEIKNLERVPEESPHPTEIYYKIDDVGLMYLLRNCHTLFKGQEYLDIEEFIYRHKDDGVLLLKATYKIQITERAESKKKGILPLAPAEAEKIAKKI